MVVWSKGCPPVPPPPPAGIPELLFDANDCNISVADNETLLLPGPLPTAGSVGNSKILVVSDILGFFYFRVFLLLERTFCNLLLRK